MGTPLDMYAIKKVHPEYDDKLALTMNVAAMHVGLPPLVMLAPVFDDAKGCCAFFDNGQCMLHEERLKPLEGKLAHCQPNLNVAISTRLIFETWLPIQKELLTAFFNK